MIAEGPHQAAVGSRPNFQGTVGAGGDDALAGRAERDGPHRPGVTGQREKGGRLGLFTELPEACGVIAGGNRQPWSLDIFRPSGFPLSETLSIRKWAAGLARLGRVSDKVSDKGRPKRAQKCPNSSLRSYSAAIVKSRVAENFGKTLDSRAMDLRA